MSFHMQLLLTAFLISSCFADAPVKFNNESDASHAPILKRPRAGSDHRMFNLKLCVCSPTVAGTLTVHWHCIRVRLARDSEVNLPSPFFQASKSLKFKLSDDSIIVSSYWSDDEENCSRGTVTDCQLTSHPESGCQAVTRITES